jgi:polyhydroxyalkanoate synthase
MSDKPTRPSPADASKPAPAGPASLFELAQAQDPAALQKLMATLAEATRESQALMADFLAYKSRSLPTTIDPTPLQAADSYAAVGKSLLSHPDKVMQAQMALWQGYVDLWQSFLTGDHRSPGKADDKRFADPEWSQNPFFYLMQKTYELNTSWLMGLIDAAEDTDSADRRKARFFMQQTVDALAPTNFFATNPGALRAFIETGGESVLEGIRQARNDLQRSGGRLSIQQVDTTPFAIGTNVATTPGQVVFRNRLIEVLHYTPVKKKVHAVPLLIFPPFINKFYILDLREENSMIRWLLGEGFDVFLVSWRSADEATLDMSWEDYITEGIDAALDTVLALTGQSQANTVGYCIGGTMLSTALARQCRMGDTRVNSVTYFASQVDFAEAGELLVFADDAAIEHIAGIIRKSGGLMPGEIMSETFNYLRPIDLVWRYVVDNYMLGRKPKPFDLLYWNADQTNIPGSLHLRYLRDLYRDNLFAKGQFTLFGERYGIADITTPAFFQAGRGDHIVPYVSTYRGALQFSGPRTFMLAGSGHIAGVINHPDAKKYQHWVNPELPASPTQWLAGATEVPGSWWPDWAEWLAGHSGGKVAARMPQDRGFGPAPGLYVRETLADIAMRRGRLGKAVLG